MSSSKITAKLSYHFSTPPSHFRNGTARVELLGDNQTAELVGDPVFVAEILRTLGCLNETLSLRLRDLLICGPRMPLPCGAIEADRPYYDRYHQHEIARRWQHA